MFDLLASTSSSGGAAGGVIGGLLGLIGAIIGIVAVWRIFSKARQRGWASIIPIYNAIVLLRIVGRPWWWLILYLIPLVGLVIYILVSLDLAKSFGKGIGYGIALMIPFVNIIPLFMLAFGEARYIGPRGANSSAMYPTPTT